MYDKVAISKELGHSASSEPIPSKELAKAEFLKAISDKGNHSAAVSLFRWYRFCPPARTKEELDAINYVSLCFKRIFTMP